eukprot:TRINITY_DN826_c0_g1_i1.p1 TRINITY_DN826_c0_g1~~TRINITY_DN826_c0_g1_i1.p1  ORF type:complete len:521 (-),score=79.46 TRINITY_DN826_c0_g1_i1:446-2008(-)
MASTTTGHPAADPSKSTVTAPAPSSSSSSSSSSKHGVGPPVDIGGNRKRYLIHNKTFDVPSHYNITKPVGFGAYGFVCAAVNTLTGQKVAIKKCANVFKEIEDGKRILREIKLLSAMRHENILGIVDLFPPPRYDSFQDIYIVCPLMDTDLHHVLRSKQKLMPDHLTYFVYQILRGLKYLHSACVLHRDLKPANLLLNIACDLRICDFGLARAYNPTDPVAELTDYVVTRWYRPPELLFMERQYTPAVDIWSTGCIFAEMITRKALFPGRDYLNQLQLLLDAVGVPPEHELDWLQQPEARQYLRAQRTVRHARGCVYSMCCAGQSLDDESVRVCACACACALGWVRQAGRSCVVDARHAGRWVGGRRMHWMTRVVIAAWFVWGLTRAARGSCDVDRMCNAERRYVRLALCSGVHGRLGPLPQQRPPKPLQDVVPGLTNPQAIDFLGKMLVFDPKRRWSAEELLGHPYVSALHDPSDEPVASGPFVWSDDAKQFTESSLRKGLWDEICRFHPECATVDPRT